MERLKQLWDSNKMKQQKIENNLLKYLKKKDNKLTIEKIQALLTLYYHDQISLFPKSINQKYKIKVDEFISEKKAFWKEAKNYKS